METIERQIPKTALDVFRMLPEGTLCEVLNNVLYMSPAPRYNHQKLITFLIRKLGNWVTKYALGEVVVSPVDVYLDEQQSAVQPDIVFIANENMSILHDDGYFYGAPDMIIEVLSSDVKRDTIVKKEIYEKAGVKEYHIVNPEDKKIISYKLVDNKFAIFNEATGNFFSKLIDVEFEF